VRDIREDARRMIFSRRDMVGMLQQRMNVTPFWCIHSVVPVDLGLGIPWKYIVILILPIGFTIIWVGILFGKELLLQA
jgi:hypothetical protein